MVWDNRLVVNPVVVLREEFDDWAVLYNPDTGDAVGTNPTGVFLWKSLDGTRTVSEIVEDVKKKFQQVPEIASDEMKQFLEQLVELGMAGVN